MLTDRLNILKRTEKETTYLKMENIDDIEYISNFNLVAEILLAWSRLKSTKELESCIKAMNEMAYYNLKLKKERDQMFQMVTDYRTDKLRAIERARKAEEQLK